MKGADLKNMLETLRDKDNRKIPKEIIARYSGIHLRTLYNLFERASVPNEQMEHINNAIKKLLQNAKALTVHNCNLAPPNSIPLYDIDVLAEKTDVLKEPSPEYVKEYYSIPGMNDSTAIIGVCGDSMYPVYKRGDKVIIKQVNDKSLIEFGQAYVIITKDNAVIKYIRKSKKERHWLLCSENPEYDEYEIPIDKVLKLFLIKGVMRTENL